MPRGFGGFNGGGNMGNLMKQAQKMQRDMEKAKEDLASMQVEATAAGGAVKVVCTCDKKITDIVLDESIVNPDDIEMLQDVLMVAINEVIEKADEKYNSEMGKITGGFNF